MYVSSKNNAWSDEEIDAVVRSYLQMLLQELAGQHYNKTASRLQLLDTLQGTRSQGSIEFKYCNISAVLHLLGYPCIRGYQPRSNIQTSLVAAVEAQIQRNAQLHAVVTAAIDQPAVMPAAPAYAHALQTAPTPQPPTSDTVLRCIARSPQKRDYLAQAARNQSLGFAGEAFVVAYEKWSLQQHGLPDLAARVEHVSQTVGDGLGFDVRSFGLDGKERRIEVKTTRFSKNTPFYVTRNELITSQSEEHLFHLYRVFDFARQPKFFTLQGNLQQHCQLDPVNYKASF